MPINLHGKQYVMVNERVQEAHKEQETISITSECISHDPVLFKATVITKKGTFTGWSAADPNKVIEAKTPYEVAETSAVGRALGFAGYGIVESIATGDEMNKGGYETKKPTTNTRVCSFHNVNMPYAVAKSGKGYYGHKVGSEFCFGNGTESEKKETESIAEDVHEKLG